MAIKTSRGGRYGKITADASGYYGRADAGQRKRKGAASDGTDREFIGSGDKPFEFIRPNGGIVIVHGNTYAEAWRIAKARGYKTRRRKKKKK